jgi:hypothetical protein
MKRPDFSPAVFVCGSVVFGREVDLEPHREKIVSHPRDCEATLCEARPVIWRGFPKPT